MEVIVLLQEATYLKPRAKSSRPPSAVISFLPVPVKAVLDRDLTVADLRVLAFFHFLSRRRRKEGKREVTVSLSTITEKTGLSRAQVIESVARLRTKGFLTKREGKKNIGTYVLAEEERKPFVFIPAPVFALPPSAVRVYALLLRRQGQNEYAYPRVRTIAADLGLTVRSVQKALRSLEAEGWIKVDGKRSRAYKVATRMPFSVEKAVPVETHASNFPTPSAEMAIPSPDLPQGDLTDLQHSPFHEETATVNADSVETPVNNFPEPNPEMAMPTQDSPGGVVYQCSPSTDVRPNGLPAFAQMVYQRSPWPVSEMQTGTNQASNEMGLNRSSNKQTGNRCEGDGQGESDFQLGGKAFSETPILSGETSPSNTRPVPQDTSPSAGKAHASPSPTTVAHSKASWLLKNAKDPVAEYCRALAEAEAELAALQEELKRAPAERRQRLEWEIEDRKLKVRGYRQRLAELKGELETGLRGTPDDLPAVQCGGDG